MENLFLRPSSLSVALPFEKEKDSDPAYGQKGGEQAFVPFPEGSAACEQAGPQLELPLCWAHSLCLTPQRKVPAAVQLGPAQHPGG